MSLDIGKGLAKGKTKKKKSGRKTSYERQREQETIRNATDRGYLRRMTVEFLNDNVGVDNKDLPTMGYLNITSLQLRSLGVLETCLALRICILPGNYLTEFDALASCVNLWVLDLHSNQIKNVPGEKFWSGLRNLQIALLHDNSISKLETIHRLSSSSSLLILTMYDTPLSLKKNYRHHVVNGIWSLRSLDYHVISDEEIIEDTKMAGQFSAMQKNFRIDVSHNLTKESPLRTAVKHFEGLLSKVNTIQAKFSPVLMIQKMVRGYLVRKRFKYLMATRVWAATSIQRFYRFYKGITKSRDDLLPPPSSPLPSDHEQYLDGEASLISHDDASRAEPDDSKSSSNTKAGSVAMQRSVDARDQIGKMASNELGREHSSYKSISSKGSKVKRRMTVDLMKLESVAMETIQSATCAVNIDSGLGLEKRPKDSKSKTSVNEKQSSGKIFIEPRKKKEEVEELFKKRRLKPEMVGKYRTVRVFLGPILESKTKKEVTDSSDDETTGFRLLGVTPPRQTNEPVAEVLMTKKEIADDIRRALRHMKKKRLNVAKKVARSSPKFADDSQNSQSAGKSYQKLTNDQKLFMRTHGTMGLACLRAVHQAYEDRERAKHQASQAERVADMKERRDEATERLRTMRLDYQDNVLKDRIRDGVKIADALRDNEKKQEKEHGKVSAQRVAAVMGERTRREETNFVREFASQQTSVSKALRSHDQAEMKKEKLTKNAEFVRREREASLEQQALVRKYMERRQLLRQAETARAQAEINERLLQEAHRQFLEIQTRAEDTKNRQAQTKEFYPLPPLNVPAIDTPLAVLSPAKFALWEALVQRDSRQCMEDTLTSTELSSDDISQYLTS